MGLPLSFLISPPKKVIRPDGSRLPDPTKNASIRTEIRSMWALLRRRQVYLLIPVLVGFGWNGTYLGIYQTK